MPTRVGTPTGHIHPALRPMYEYMEDGTREPFESDWTLIVATHSVQFQHDFDEVPMTVNVMRSIASEGNFPHAAPSTDYTVAYTNTDGDSGSGRYYVTITNNSTDTDYYFKVRAQ